MQTILLFWLLKDNSFFKIRQEVSEKAERFDASVKMFGPKR